MKNARQVILSVLLLVSLSRCSKKDDPSFTNTANTPEFFSTGKIDGVNLSIMAGVSGYTQTYTTTHNGLYYQFKSLLSSPGCVTCPGKLQIAFNDSSLVPNGQKSHILNHLTAGKNIEFGFGSQPLANAGKVIITWTNSFGTMYTSELKKQTSPVYFRITEIGPYTFVSDSIRTITRVKAEFECTVYTPANDSLTLQNIVTVFAIDNK